MDKIAVFYLHHQGQIWQVRTDGTWILMTEEQVQSIDAPVGELSDYLKLLNGTEGVLVLNDVEIEIPAAIVSSMQPLLNPQAKAQVADAASDSNLLNGSSSASQSQTSGTFFFTTIRRDAEEMIAESGFDTLPDNPAKTSVFQTSAGGDLPPDIVPTGAEITVTIEDGGDGFENRFEVPKVDVHGTAEKLDDRTLTITITDVNDTQLNFEALVIDGLWRLDAVDLSTLAEGVVTATASIADSYGNSVEAHDDTIKDTVAQVTIDFGDGGDQAINQFEVGAVSLSGDALGIEDGHRVEILISDGTGRHLRVQGSVVDEKWQVLEQDLTSFEQGSIVARIVSVDTPGNPAFALGHSTIDTLASISAFAETGHDQIINRFEQSSVRLFGSLSNIEDGQSIQVSVTDINGLTLSFESVASTNSWERVRTDLSALADGALTLNVETADLAGNPASANYLFEKDTFAQIEAKILDDDGLINPSELQNLRVGGTVQGVEDGQLVSLIVTDQFGHSAVRQVAVTNGQWYTVLDVRTLLDGQMNLGVEVQDRAGNIAVAGGRATIDTTDGMTINIESGDDNYLNRFEVPATLVSGDVTDIDDGATVSIVLSDVHGHEVFLSAVVIDGRWSAGLQNLTEFDEGPIFALATVQDEAGNRASAIDFAIIDRLAEVSLLIDSGDDSLINLAEQLAISLSGAASHIENGQLANVLLTDIYGHTLRFETTLVDGQWQLDNLDVSSLAEGIVSASVKVVDIAGNPASDSNTAVKDTLAELSVTLDPNGDQLFNPRELSDVPIEGNVTNIEDGQVVTITVTATDGTTFTTQATVLNSAFSTTADLRLFPDGPIHVFAQAEDIAGNRASDSDSGNIDLTDGLTITIDSGDDNYINASELPVRDVFGTTEDVENGRTVTLILTDFRGHTEVLTTRVLNSAWRIEAVDFSVFDEGYIIAEASVLDRAGNLASGIDIAQKDTQIDAQIIIDPDSPEYVNAAEQLAVNILSQFHFVEDGQDVSLKLSDQAGTEQMFNIVKNGGDWLLEEVDFSNFEDGLITAQVTITDIAGNTVTATDTVIKDTQAQLTLELDANGDGLLNPLELSAVSISGTVLNVEDGQWVEITLTDIASQQITVTAMVQGSMYQTTADVRTFVDGVLLATAKVVDVAGNTASASDNVLVDTTDGLTIVIETGGDPYLNANEIGNVRIHGTATDIENGQTVVVEVATFARGIIEFDAVIENGVWEVAAADLTSLSDGVLYALAVAQDLAGNIASAVTSTVKDTLANIDVTVAQTEDGYLNGAESLVASLLGNASHVNDGQTVTIAVTDSAGAVLTGSAIVEGEDWSTDTFDWTSVAEGLVTVDVEVVDEAGNPAQSSYQFTKDTHVGIDIDTGTGFDIEIARVGLPVFLSGTTTAEAGQWVTVTISDGLNEQAATAQVQDDQTWSTGDFIIDQLDLVSSIDWTLTASVEDIAGNLAEDDFPTIVEPSSVYLSEQALGLFSATTATSELRISGAQLTFSSIQSELESLTSDGQALVLNVSADEKSFQLSVQASSDLVMSGEISDNSRASITLHAPVDQPEGIFLLRVPIVINGLQTDADGTEELVVARLDADILDSTPFAVDDSYSVVEAEVSAGSLIANDTTLEGPLVVTKIVANGESHSIAPTRLNEISFPEGTLVVTSSGAWSFLSHRNLDHTQPQSIEFSYDVIDHDGDPDRADVIINITDGAAGHVSDVDGHLVEPKVGSNILGTASFEVTAGSDDLIANSIRFHPDTIDRLESLNITSLGDTVEYALSADEKQIQATTSGTSVDVFTLSLSALSKGGSLEAEGSLFLMRPIDHNATDIIYIDLSVVANDADGTNTVGGRVQVTVSDGETVALSISQSVHVDEDNLPSALTGTGSIAVETGSDDVATIEIDRANNQPPLTSGGQVIQYQLSGDGLILTGYVLDPLDPVFKVILNSDFAPEVDSSIDYVYEQYQSLDQGSDASTVDQLIPIRIIATDSDGDETLVTLDITVSDGDAPIIVPDKLSLVVGEIPRDLVHAPLVDEVDSTSVTVTAGKDPIVDVVYDIANGSLVVDQSGTVLTQNGQSLTWRNRANGELDVVLSDGTSVLNFKLPDDISTPSETDANFDLVVTQIGPIDHLDGNDLQIGLMIPLEVVDSDGSIGRVDLSVIVHDGRDPRISSGADMTVDENDLSAGTVMDTTQVTIDRGSDRVADVAPDKADFDSLNLSSGGLAITLSSQANANGWWLAKTSAGTEVFRVKFERDGSVSFELKQAIDHPDAAARNELEIPFNVTVIDTDNDESAPIEVKVTVTDDVPTARLGVIAITEGDSETRNILPETHQGADGAEVYQVSYRGTLYQAGETIDLTTDDGAVYGTLVIDKNGDLDLQTTNVLSTGLVFRDNNISYTVRDFDKDVVNNSLEIELLDSAGYIDTGEDTTTEDVPLKLEILASPADVDDDESIVSMTFDSASLKGGTLTLNDVALKVDGSGNPFLSAAANEFITVGNRNVIPNGDLVYTPLLNSSDQTQTVSIGIRVEVQRGGVFDRHIDDTYDLTIISDADVPVWNANTFEYAITEDASATAISIEALLADTDGSEALSYEVLAIDNGLSLTSNTTPIEVGSVLTAAELAQLKALMGQNLAGEYQFSIKAISIEAQNSDQASDDRVVTLKVAPVADIPQVASKNIRGTEDTDIDLSAAIVGQLSDDDGSETLYYRVDVQDGWLVLSNSGANVTDLGGNRFEVLAKDVEAGAIQLRPAANISEVTDTATVSVTAIARESSQDGIAPSVAETLGNSTSFDIKLTGVPDIPILDAAQSAGWTLDPDTLQLTNSSEKYEDEDLALDFVLTTVDQDGSEVMNFLLKDIPDGVELVDSAGHSAQLPVVDVVNGNPTFQVTSSQLNQLFLSIEEDFSGPIDFTIQQIVTEEDGASESYDIAVTLVVTPVIDTSGVSQVAQGAEDRVLSLNLMPNTSADMDGSETVTGAVITDLLGMRLFIDGTEQVLPANGLDLANYTDAISPNIESLLRSGRISILPPEDAAGQFSLPIRYTIADTSALEVVRQDINVNVSVDINARVESDTIISSPRAYISDDGSAIALDGAVSFTDADLDGSEVVDYLVIIAPDANNWFVQSDREVIHDGNGRWIIDVSGLTSDSVKETVQDLLANTTVNTQLKGTFELGIEARILDGQDAEIRNSSLILRYNTASSGGTASQVNDLQDSVIDAIEESGAISTSDHLNTSIAGDANDVVSFRVDASDLRHGETISGSGVLLEYDASGQNVIAYLFRESDISSLSISDLDSDFAGVLTIPVTVIATDPSGDTFSEQQDLVIEVAPKVDGVQLNAKVTEIDEDVATVLGLNFVFADSNIPNEGIETLSGTLQLQLPDGGRLQGPGILQVNPTTWQVNDLSTLDQIEYIGPAQDSGQFRVVAIGNVVDIAQGIGDSVLTDSQSSTSEIVIDVLPVTDSASITPRSIFGDEDSAIDMSAISAVAPDNDGSELVTFEFFGVPHGAVLFYEEGGLKVEAANNGRDGGDFDGSPTYVWSLPESALSSLTLTPPLDFSGTIPLEFVVIRREQGTEDIVSTSQTIEVQVNPVGDDVQSFNPVLDYQVDEGDTVNIKINAESLETNSNETLEMVIRIDTTNSDSSAIDGLSGIRADGDFSAFVTDASGTYATIQTSASAIEQVQLVLGDSVFGHLEAAVEIRSFDQASISGSIVSDYGDALIENIIVDIAPFPDAPILTLNQDNLYAEEGVDIPINIDLAQQSPAPGENAFVIIQGAPDHVTFSNGQLNPEGWTIAQAQVPNLKIEGLVAGDTFSLTFIPYSELGSDRADGSVQTMTIGVVADNTDVLSAGLKNNILYATAGDDTISSSAGNDVLSGGTGSDNLSGGLGSDRFVFNQGDDTGGANDAITDFALGADSLDLTGLLAAVNSSSGAELDLVVDLSENAGDTTLSIKLDQVNVTQEIVLDGVSINDLAGGGSTAEADILQKLIDDGTLVSG